jgi:hypothetical protein
MPVTTRLSKIDIHRTDDEPLSLSSVALLLAASPGAALPENMIGEMGIAF